MADIEVNFDGLVGPTHNYAGLSFGNVASTSHGGKASNPKAAALQGLQKMRILRSLGVAQGVLPPQERPSFKRLAEAGLEGDHRSILSQAAKLGPLLSSVYSASPMWAANAATVSPSSNTKDGRVHFTPANLASTLHRSIEGESTFRALSKIFSDQDHFQVHQPLPAIFADEGAANHTRLVDNAGNHLEVFVYGRSLFHKAANPKKFPARQVLEASEAIARHHQLKDGVALFLKQNPDAIDAGAFHNDVVAVGHRRIWFQHEEAFLPETLELLRSRFPSLEDVIVPASVVSLEEAVRSYLFNSQIVTTPTGSVLIAPQEASEGASGKYLDAYMQEIGPIEDVYFIDLKESMQNGGGPACLRLRVALTSEEMRAVHQPVLLDEDKLTELENWVNKHYRDQLTFDDLADPDFVVEVYAALDELTEVLELGSDFYDFQRLRST